jgi:chorismate mutase-like protein
MPEVSALRQRIDEIDRTVVALLNERAELAVRIGREKKNTGAPLYDPAREEEIMRHVTSLATGPLPPAAMRRVFERIIDETRAVERTSAGV